MSCAADARHMTWIGHRDLNVLDDLHHPSPPARRTTAMRPITASPAAAITGNPSIVPRATTDVSRSTKLLLTGGAIAGPLYVAVGLAQIATRDGFDIRRHSLSVLANGDYGWVQITNLIVTGLLAVGAAIGLARTCRPARSRWAPRLQAVYGLGLVSAGIFRADPMDGFPRGTPLGTPDTVSSHAIVHFTSGGIGFVALIIACFVTARHDKAEHRGGWASYSRFTGIAFLAGFAGIASGGGNHALNVAFALSVVIAWAWVSAIALDRLATTPVNGRDIA
jgi:Protein of unknown function (DUF998)